jgi:hypothetical protein
MLISPLSPQSRPSHIPTLCLDNTKTARTTQKTHQNTHYTPPETENPTQRTGVHLLFFCFSLNLSIPNILSPRISASPLLFFLHHGITNRISILLLYLYTQRKKKKKSPLKSFAFFKGLCPQ